MIRIGAPPNRVDFLNFLGSPEKELNWDDVVARSIRAELLDVEVAVLSREDFIESKRSAGRPKDLRDLADLAESTDRAEP